jgi:hypothetical protein
LTGIVREHLAGRGVNISNNEAMRLAQTVARSNNIVNANMIHPGQKLNLDSLNLSLQQAQAVNQAIAANKAAAAAALVDNQHAVLAPGGTVLMSAQAAQELQGGVIQPDVGDVQTEEDAIRARFPGEAESHGLAIERFLSFGDEIGDGEGFAATPDTGGVIERQFLFGSLGIAVLFWFECGENGCGRLLKVRPFEFPAQAHAEAVAGLVLKQQDMVLRREDADAAVVVGIPVFTVDWQDGHGRELGVRRQVAQAGAWQGGGVGCHAAGEDRVGAADEGVWWCVVGRERRNDSFFFRNARTIDRRNSRRESRIVRQNIFGSRTRGR